MYDMIAASLLMSEKAKRADEIHKKWKFEKREQIMKKLKQSCTSNKVKQLDGNE